MEHLFVSSPTSTNHYLNPDTFRFIIPTITYSTTTVISTTSTPITRYSTSTREVVTTTPTTITSTSTVIDYATSTIIHYSTSTQVITNTEEITVDNPYSYPYTIDPITKEVTYYIYSSNNITATSSNPLDTPCTLNLKTCKSSIHSIVGILKNYEEEHGYQEDLNYTKYYPSQYYEYDTRGITTLNIPFNGKVVATLKYGKNLYEYNSGSDTKQDCTLASSNCTLHTEMSYLHNDYLATPKVITNSQASTTEVITRDVWGSVINNNINSNQQVPTSFGLTGHKWDENSALTYSHARYLNNNSKIWLSHDPFSIENFSSNIWLLNPSLQNSYSYATNDPVNKVDPDGKLTIIVPGTWWTDSTWSTSGNPLYQNALNQFGEIPKMFNDPQKWSGGNNDYEKQVAGNYLQEIIDSYEFKDGEKLNIIAHSHGGNVAKIAINMMQTNKKVDNFYTFGTPVNGNYWTDMSKVKNMKEIYSNNDMIQSHGGNERTYSVLGKWMNNLLNNGRSPENDRGVYFEGGNARRYENFNNAIDVTSYTSQGPWYTGGQTKEAHSELYSVTSIWTNKVFPKK